MGLDGIKFQSSFYPEQIMLERINNLTHFFNQSIIMQYDAFIKNLASTEKIHNDEQKALEYLFDSKNFKKGYFYTNNMIILSKFFSH